ncbi:MATE efflux family protein [Nostocoides australiense Ben110]|uniref:MATE efflux family protein n=1 Tax=Nostocoides australiense Ben110 TaxID=1193182 RepID=W6K1S4_9MICO|nr:MATE family efflux transporter [Tetrasphaera australiensis]CCH75417.1 MATE efflux family protein [Tetrasphaera australiensis Ben110]
MESDVSPSRQVLQLAIPAFLALIAEPLFLLADTAIVGHLGTAPLAGLGLASSALLTAVGVFVFLAYGTTAVVARQLGAGNVRAAIAAGVDGTWLAVGLGLVVAAPLALAARPVCRWLGGEGAALTNAVGYLRIAAFGIPPMLVVMAVTGVLRGLLDTRTPLVVNVVGAVVNVVLNVLFVYGFRWGIAGSAIGTLLVQAGMASALVLVLLRHARADDAPLRPHPGRVLAAAIDGIPLLVRTLALRAILLLTTWVAAGLGVVPLAAHQVTATIWSFLVFALDAIAIAAQALTGRALGAGDARSARELTSLMIRWGIWSGLAVGVVVLALHRVLPALFTDDPGVRAAVAAGLVVVAVGQVLSGFVFVIDGVLIGAGDARWLSMSMCLVLVAYLPMVLAVRAFAPTDPPLAITWLWVAFTGFMLVRAVFLGWRVRSDRWMVLGAGR